ncbi:MAG: FAD:protein FMN transferase [Christensenellaceae bacterium]|nr:FAD:protein FMN transferase [Christensenellaceae bacterium]
MRHLSFLASSSRLLALALLLSLCACAAPKPASAESFAFDTILRASVYAASGDATPEALAAGALRIADGLEPLLSAHAQGAEIATANEKREALLSQESAALLREALRLFDESGGAFDPRLGALSALWDFKSASPSLPDPARIEALLRDARGSKIELAGKRLTLGGETMQIDLGAIAKGYAADRMRAWLLENGASCALLELGGSIVTIGERPGGGPWRIAVASPFAQGEIAGVLRVEEGFLSTSSGAQRGFTLEGERYHHILDPETGWPARSGLASVTVVAPNGVLADALSTAFFVLGQERALELLRARFPGVEAVFIREDGGTLCTKEGLFEAS